MARHDATVKRALCAHCGTQFERRTSTPYCSDDCRTAAKREQNHQRYLANRDEALARSRAWREANPERYRQWHEEYSRGRYLTKKPAIRQQIMAQYRADQAETLPQARRYGYMWTGPELELASRDDLTSKQVALMTGRTLSAVVNVRHRLSTDPRKISLAGLNDPEDAMTGAGMTFGIGPVASP